MTNLLRVASWLSILAAGVAFVLTLIPIARAFTGEWEAARALSVMSAKVCVGVVVLAPLVVIPMTWLLAWLGVRFSGGDEPGGKARVLAEGISHWMNCSALAFPVGAVAALVCGGVVAVAPGATLNAPPFALLLRGATFRACISGRAMRFAAFPYSAFATSCATDDPDRGGTLVSPSSGSGSTLRKLRNFCRFSRRRDTSNAVMPSVTRRIGGTRTRGTVSPTRTPPARLRASRLTAWSASSSTA
jgi:hypothetical protein